MGENWGSSGRISTPNNGNKLDLTFWVADYGAKFHQNRVRIATVEKVTDRQTNVTDASEFIICPMLCYSNGTDNNSNTDKHKTIYLQECAGHGV